MSDRRSSGLEQGTHCSEVYYLYDAAANVFTNQVAASNKVLVADIVRAYDKNSELKVKLERLQAEKKSLRCYLTYENKQKK